MNRDIILIISFLPFSFFPFPFLFPFPPFPFPFPLPKKNRDPSYPARFAFIEFSNPQAATNATAFHGSLLGSRALKISMSKNVIGGNYQGPKGEPGYAATAPSSRSAPSSSASVYSAAVTVSFFFSLFFFYYFFLYFIIIFSFIFFFFFFFFFLIKPPFSLPFLLPSPDRCRRLFHRPLRQRLLIIWGYVCRSPWSCCWCSSIPSFCEC